MAKNYEEQVQEIAQRADSMRAMLYDPLCDVDSGEYFTPKDRAGVKLVSEKLAGSIKGSVYESLGEGGKMVAAVHSRCIAGYAKKHGHLPSDEILASCHKAIENVEGMFRNGGAKGTFFESADMSSSEGILMRDRLVSLVLPVQLRMVTSAMVTFIPGEFNQSEFFRIRRVAGSNFGDYRKGDKLDYDYTGNYSVMDQYVKMADADGAAVSFTFSTEAKYGVKYPIKRHSVKIEVGGNLYGQDNGSGAISGTFVASDSSVAVVSGTVDYTNGVVQISTTKAIPAGSSIFVAFDVDIEKEPLLIPRVDHQMESRVLYPHESAISGNATIQALWLLRRELGQDIENMNMQAMRNLLAADKDRKHLRDMRRHSDNRVVEWCYEYIAPDAGPGITLREHYETLNVALLEMDTKLRRANGISGLVGIVGGSAAVNVFRYLPAPYFQPADGYVSVPQPHYVGRVFGQWDLYCDPLVPDNESFNCLCFAKGPDHGQTAYVAGDAVPALTFRHPVMGDLVTRATMWDLAYRDMQPFDGNKYLGTLKMVPAV